MTKPVLVTPEAADARERERAQSAGPAVGDWYWVKDKHHDGRAYRWLGCITHVGSNYFQLTSTR